MKTANSVAVITGAASGIGEAVAVALAAMGAKVILADRDETKLQAVKTKILAEGHQADFMICDVTDETSVRALMQFAVTTFGSINIVLACAGIIRDAFLVTPDKETGKVKKFM
eukprot:Opistho-2@22985